MSLPLSTPFLYLNLYIRVAHVYNFGEKRHLAACGWKDSCLTQSTNFWSFEFSISNANTTGICKYYPFPVKSRRIIQIFASHSHIEDIFHFVEKD